MPHLVLPEDVLALVAANFAGRVRWVDGEAEIAPGISVHRVGGHTPGMQVVRVATALRYVVLASDASHFYENVGTDPVRAQVWIFSGTPRKPPPTGHTVSRTGRLVIDVSGQEERSVEPLASPIRARLSRCRAPALLLLTGACPASRRPGD
jgi:hypothetical protein